MRKPMPYVSLHDIPLDLVDGDCDGSCCPDGGLCCPDDPLDKVINYVSVLDDGFLEALGIDCSLSPPREVPPAPVTAPGGRDGDDEYSKSAEDMDVDVGALGGGRGKLNACDMSGGVPEFALAAESALVAGSGGKLNACDMSCGVPESASATPGGCSDACGALAGFVSNGAPPLPASYALSCSASTTSTTSSGCSLSSTSWETESPPLASPFQAWAVPRKRRRRPTTVCKRPWSLVFPLVLVPAAAHDSHADNNGNGGNDGEFSCGNGVGGGIVRRRLVAQQRNRQAQRTCCHCHTSETPQWRAGPDGPGTLCNACGIRYKMKKLLPEYRPSTSPGFRSGEHSNRHRKVVKLREQKEKTLTVMPATLPPAPNAGEVLRLCTYYS